jgi:hypothetical protein
VVELLKSVNEAGPAPVGVQLFLLRRTGARFVIFAGLYRENRAAGPAGDSEIAVR